jgi:hypothetical protein
VVVRRKLGRSWGGAGEAAGVEKGVARTERDRKNVNFSAGGGRRRTEEDGGGRW